MKTLIERLAVPVALLTLAVLVVLVGRIVA